MRPIVLLAVLCAGCGTRSALDVPDASVARATDVISIDTGGSSCALRTGGRISCWGRVLGRPLEEEAILWEATDLYALPGAIEVRVGWYHACARLESGAVYCWGSNCAGQLGTAGMPWATEPLEVPGIDDAVDIDLGWNFTCIVRRSGEVWCWGRNDRGQLGDGTRADAPVFDLCDVWITTPTCCDGRAAPRRVDGITDAVEVTLGTTHACARSATGRVRCWGANDRGQLGDGSFEDRSRPVEVLGVEDSIGLRTGDATSCVLRSDGGLTCWGANDCGQLGVGSGPGGDSPVAVRAANLDRPAVEVSIGSQHGCLIDRSGAASCWGRVRASGGGSPPFPGRGCRSTLGPVLEWPGELPLTGGVELSAAVTHTCLLDIAGRVLCWGSGYDGELGHVRGEGLYAEPVDGLDR